MDAPPVLDDTPAPPNPSEVGDRRGRWVTAVAAVVLLLSVTGSLNIWLNRGSTQATTASSTLLRLDSMLHEEGTLQWRALAERGAPTRVAAAVGSVRAEEFALIDELAAVLPIDEVGDLRQLVDDYHVALDEELSLLAVGRAGDALAFEHQVTAPLFDELSGWLEDRSVAAAAVASRRSRLAHVVLVGTLAVVAVVIALLAWRVARAHHATLAVSAQLLEQERRQVQALRRSEASIRHQAEHDPLTGLANRLRFQRDLASAVAAEPVAVLYVDLDGFKAVNDRFGHAAGDDLLGVVAERLRRCARGSDTIARLGGDEFAILLADADRDLATEVADRVVERLSEPVQLGENAVRVGASVGVAVGGRGADPDELLKDADRRMYAVKHRRERTHRMEQPIASV